MGNGCQKVIQTWPQVEKSFNYNVHAQGSSVVFVIFLYKVFHFNAYVLKNKKKAAMRTNK